MYLNPEVVARSNVATVEDVVDRYATEFTHLPYIVPTVPGSAIGHIANNRDTFDVSALNRVFQEANKTENDDPLGGAAFVPNIYKRVQVVDTGASGTGVDTFRVIDDDPGYVLTKKHIQIDDEVRIVLNDGTRTIHGRVRNIGEEGSTFSIYREDALSSPLPLPLSTSSLYLTTSGGGEPDEYESNPIIVYGIRVSDPTRIADVNLSRQRQPKQDDEGHGDNGDDIQVPPSPSSFNPELYRLLYPDTRFLSAEEAFVHFQNKWSADEYRISSASDILNSDVPVFRTDTKTVFEAEVEARRDVLLKGERITGISRDNVGPPEASEEGRLITEKAIKEYVTVPLRTRQHMNDLAVSGRMDVAGGVYAAGGVDVTGGMRCRDGLISDVSIINRIEVGNGFDDYVVNDEDGCACAGSLSNVNVNVGFHNAYVSDRLMVGSKWVLQEEDGSGSPDGPDGPSSLAIRRAGSDMHHEPTPPTFLVREDDTVVVHGDLQVMGRLSSLSDEREKRDIKKLSSCHSDNVSALDKLAGLSGYTFHYRREKEGGACGRSGGLLAQEVMRVLPEAVRVTATPTTREQIHTVSYEAVIGLLVDAVNQLSSRDPSCPPRDSCWTRPS